MSDDMYDDDEAYDASDMPTARVRESASESFWLTDMADVLRETGLIVSEWPGWKTRARSSGGYRNGVKAIGHHHGAFSTSTTTNQAARYMWENATYRPIGNCLVGRNGHWVIGAAGATNTQGRGGPVHGIPQDQGNTHMLSIETMNDGAGEPWAPQLVEALVTGSAALCEWLGLDPLRDQYAHFEWTNPGADVYRDQFRKIDPAGGESRYGLAGTVYPNMWDMDAFRLDVATATTGDDMIPLEKAARLYDSRDHAPLVPGQPRAVALLNGTTSSMAEIRVAAGDALFAGYLEVSASPEPDGDTALVNFSPDTYWPSATGIVKVPEDRIVYVTAYGETNPPNTAICQFTMSQRTR